MLRRQSARVGEMMGEEVWSKKMDILGMLSGTYYSMMLCVPCYYVIRTVVNLRENCSLQETKVADTRVRIILCSTHNGRHILNAHKMAAHHQTNETIRC